MKPVNRKLYYELTRLREKLRKDQQERRGTCINCGKNRKLFQNSDFCHKCVKDEDSVEKLTLDFGDDLWYNKE